MAEDFDNDDEDRREERRARRSQPRFGSFITIAAAILMLFGAASRVGKMPEIPALFGIDQAQQNYLLQDQRARTVAHLGALPASPESLRPQTPGLPIDRNAQPPIRHSAAPEGERGGNGLRPPSISMVAPDERSEPGYPMPRHDDNDIRPPTTGNSLRPDLQTRRPVNDDRPWTGTYTVANGDTWVKIAKRTLGDGSRWEELRKANPSAQKGLRVGMQLKVPN